MRITIKKIPLTILLICICMSSYSQRLVKGSVIDVTTNLPIEGAIISVLPANKTITTDIRGKFFFSQADNITAIMVSSIGYEIRFIPVSVVLQNEVISLHQQKIQLTNVTVTTKAGEEYKIISKTDIKMRGVNNSQEILRMVPGLFIGQHQGGGKAEQIFVRGFDCDHGTDINIMADGIPVNMVSQAHGQGYADMHFIIPETVENVDFQKGPYNAGKGNFTTSGFVDLKTKNGLSNNTVKLEGGMFDTYRALGMFNLLNEQAKQKQQSWYVASEYSYSNGFFDHPQDFHRFNFFTKYNGKLTNKTYLVLSASTFNSKWNASGQIPDRAVESGLIGFYGAIDSTEGGETSRSNINAQFITTLQNQSYFKNQFYYSNYYFDLHTDFTFYLNDPVNGDQIRQKENRNLFGYNGSYHKNTSIGATQITSEIGAGFRWDLIQNLELSHTKDRFTLLERLAYGNVSETDLFAYANETFHFSEKFSMNAGLRVDQFINQYTDHLKADSVLKATAAIVSPKLSFYYKQNNSTQFYLNLGKGFHSNNTKVCVMEKGRQVLPAAYAADAGTVVKPTNNLLLQFALWYLWLDQEFVYNGDDGTAQPSGKTSRTGFDLSLRYEPVQSVYVDADVNYAHGRFVEEAKGLNYIPLAPIWSGTGGVTYKNKSGINGSIRYRWLSNRPANENYSLTANGYFVNDIVLNYTQKKYEIGVAVNNIFNVQWKETQFDTESRLKNEPAPVDEIHFTPGTKFAAKLSFSIFF
jgi:outer membrane receptor for Fe3+-dicitrate